MPVPVYESPARAAARRNRNVDERIDKQDEEIRRLKKLVKKLKKLFVKADDE